MQNQLGKRRKIISLVCILMLCFWAFAGCASADKNENIETSVSQASTEGISYAAENYSVERNKVSLHVGSLSAEGTEPEKDILLVHGLTYSSHEFDVNYGDYSLARYLVRNGFRVWKFDVAGYGQSEEVKDGFMPDSEYAAKDIDAVVQMILAKTGRQKIYILGWSWGTVTSSIYAGSHPECIEKLVLYAPIMSGLGKQEVKTPFNHNTWDNAASDFQFNSAGEIDNNITESGVVSTYLSDCWKYDGESSPNGGRADLMTDKEHILIHPETIKVPVLVICGDNDPYMNMDLVRKSINSLPKQSELKVIKGAAHCAMMEKPYYREFRESVCDFLKK